MNREQVDREFKTRQGREALIRRMCEAVYGNGKAIKRDPLDEVLEVTHSVLDDYGHELAGEDIAFARQHWNAHFAEEWRKLPDPRPARRPWWRRLIRR
ncbi:hypothetical protein [Actinoallomurus sp. NPDC052274]|uniref:hypothetical protein n=1 Tax=Actinoallomurus sp. NPDC052274 TaxID=3155420 RepID=UPI00342F479E